jgi:cation diffusion facilitator CzcD-associated flavoprotein CzcO
MTWAPSRLPKVCIIGAGCSGFTTAKRLKDAGVPYDCFEASDDVGGNWYYKNPNGLSACYESLHIDTSKWRLAFEDFPGSARLARLPPPQPGPGLLQGLRRPFRPARDHHLQHQGAARRARTRTACGR